MQQGDSPRKGRIFNELLKTIKKEDPDLPIVIINHMTPYHDTVSTAECVRRVKEKTKGCHMIVNSYQAAQQWDHGTPIIHGIFPEEWGWDTEYFYKTGEYRDAVKEPRVSIMLSPAGMEKAYRREFLKATLDILDDYGVPVTWIGVDTNFQSFDEYRDYLAKSLIFFFPAWQSPMPRSRTESMLSGCCVVTTPYHGAKNFINSGVLKQNKKDDKVISEELIYDEDTNGFLTSMSQKTDLRTISNPKYTADLIRKLVFENPDIALEIGKRGQKTAIEKFDHKIFAKQWIKFLKEKNIWKAV
jgi:glycosyltransferase involved in cell wall biosynthesis